MKILSIKFINASTITSCVLKYINKASFGVNIRDSFVRCADLERIGAMPANESQRLHTQ